MIRREQLRELLPSPRFIQGPHYSGRVIIFSTPVINKMKRTSIKLSQ